MWIQLKQPKQIKIAGKAKQYQIGDWVNIPNTNQAMQWIANDEAKEAPNFDFDFEDNDIGIASPYNILLPYNIPVKQVQTFEPVFNRTVFLNKNAGLNHMPEVIRNVGKLATVFNLLKTYEVVLFLRAFKENALHFGKAEHERTLSLIGDLRVKVYSSEVFAMQDTKTTRKFCEVLEDEMQYGKELAMTRAFYQVKPIAYFINSNWIK